MRLKPFIIFIIIFTIVYFVGFAIYDKIKNKKDEEKTIKGNYELLNIEKLKKFALFYNINITIDVNTLILMYDDFREFFSIPINNTAAKYNVSKEELIVIIEYLEYIGLIKTRSIHLAQDNISNPTTKEESLIIKYGLLFSGKYDFITIKRNIGIGAEKEVELLMENHLIPGVKMENSEIMYVGDLDE